MTPLPGRAAPRRLCVLGLALPALVPANSVHAQPVNPDQTAAGLPAIQEPPAPGPPGQPVPLAEKPAPEIRLGDMRSLLGQLPPSQPTGAPASNWTIVPSIGLQEMATDNVFSTASSRRADLVTSLSPGILINGDTQRLRATISYAPQLQLYAFTPGQNNIAQNFNGEATVSVIPGWLLVNAQAFATQQAISGGYAPGGTPVLTNQNRADVTSFTITPYLSHTFDGIGTGQLGYAFNHSSQSGVTAVQPSSALPFFMNNDISTSEEFAKFSTGENFGRINNKVILKASQNTGQGIVDNSHENFYTDTFAYALNRSISLVVEGGYEQIAYPNGIPPFRVDDLVWAGGFKLQPNPDSTIIALYRHLYGVNAPYLDATYALTARTKLYASYSDIIGTQTQILQDTLAETTLGGRGTPVDLQTGAPVLVVNQLLGVQNGLVRQKQLMLRTSTGFERDTVSLNALHQSQTLLSVSSGLSGFSQSGTSGGITWTHDLSTAASSTLYLQYGVLSFSEPGAATGSQRILTGSLALTYNFSQSVSGTIQYVLTNNISLGSTVQPTGLPAQGFLDNVVLLGILKRF